jgi:hypothetical protein
MPALPPGDEKRCKEFRDHLKTIELELCPVCEELTSTVMSVPYLSWTGVHSRTTSSRKGKRKPAREATMGWTSRRRRRSHARGLELSP